jgi:hypothetical protein
VASLQLRWSEHEARKPYARPFMVTFTNDAGEQLGSIGVSGADLLYWRQFVTAVAALTGELFIHDDVDDAADPQRAWLQKLTQMMPPAGELKITPASTFDHDLGRVFGFRVSSGGDRHGVVVARTLLEYQELQAALAHQCGRLLRVAAVEAIDDAAPRQRAWLDWLNETVSRPPTDEAMSREWPWR